MTIYGYDDVARMVRLNPEAFAASGTWAEFVLALGQATLVDYSWAKACYRTMKLNPAVTSGHPLLFPEARQFSDLFEYAIYDKAYAGPGNSKTGTPVKHVPGYYLLGATSAKGAAHNGNHGGKRYISVFSDNTVVRGRSGADFYVTKVKPRHEVIYELHDPHGRGLNGSFEAIRWPGGHVLVTYRDSAWPGSDWLAVLAPDASVDEILDPEHKAFIEAEAAEDQRCWGAIYMGSDGREYVHRDQVPADVEVRVR